MIAPLLATKTTFSGLELADDSSTTTTTLVSLSLMMVASTAPRCALTRDAPPPSKLDPEIVTFAPVCPEFGTTSSIEPTVMKVQFASLVTIAPESATITTGPVTSEAAGATNEIESPLLTGSETSTPAIETEAIESPPPRRPSPLIVMRVPT